VSYQYDGLGQLTTIPGYASNGQYNFAGRLTRIDAANGTGRTKEWDASRGTLDGYQWTGTGKDSRVLGWDIRGNLSTQTKDGYSASYLYDAQNRLVYSQEGWPVEVTSKDNPNARYGVRERDVAGREGLDYTQSAASIKFDYHATSVGLNLETGQSINKIFIARTGSRLSERTVEVYVSQSGGDGSWTKVEGTTLIADQEGVTIQFESSVSAQYVKVHSVWDERNAENMPVDNSAIAGTPAQLIEVYSTANGQTTSWSYDSLGNRISEDRYRGSSSSIEHEYYENASLLKTRGGWSFNYDTNGNMTERGTNGTWNAATGKFTWDAASGELWIYAYDLKNRLMEAKHGKAGSGSLKSTASYAYDIRDLRVQTVKAGETTYYQYDQYGNLVWTETSTTTTKYVQALGQIWAEVQTSGSVSATYFHHTDHLGSTELITDAAGMVAWSANYEAFGSVSRSNGTLTFTPSFTGKQLDADTGLYYFNARWYDPNLGRFISEDPARDGDNWVAYVSNNLLAYTDPDGRSPTVAAGFIVGAIVGFGTGTVSALIEGKGLSTDTLSSAITGAASGAVVGAIAGTGVGLVGFAIAGGATAAAGSVANSVLSAGMEEGLTGIAKLDPNVVAKDAAVSGAIGLVSGGLGAKLPVGTLAIPLKGALTITAIAEAKATASSASVNAWSMYGKVLAASVLSFSVCIT